MKPANPSFAGCRNDLAARARVFVVAVVELRGAEILADLEVRQQSVCRLDASRESDAVDLAFRLPRPAAVVVLLE